MSFSFEEAQVFLPKYLSPEDRRELFSEIQKFQGASYYSTVDDAEPIQGDGWADVNFVDIEAVSKRSVRAMILSNSCDLASANPRKLPPRITVTPLIRLSRLSERLLHYGASAAQVESYLADIRKQEISNAFFLPEGNGVEEDSVVFFDNMQSPLLETFTNSLEHGRLFSLSQFGFWLLLIKLAIHFCRAQEGIKRSGGTAAV